MQTAIIAPPADIVTADQAKAWQPVFAADSSERVAALLQVAQATLEPPNGWVGRAFGIQTLRVDMRHWSACGEYPTWRDRGALVLPYPPLRAVVSVVYVDTDGDELTLPPEAYTVAGIGTGRGQIWPADGSTWPALAFDRPDAVQITLEAGYDVDDRQLLPVKHAIVLAASHLRSLGTQELTLRTREVEGVGSRTWTVSDAAEKLVKSAVEGLLLPFRAYA